MEWRVGGPLAAAAFFIGLKIVESVLSRAPWTFDRGIRIGIASAFLLLILWSWRLIREDLKALNRIFEANRQLGINAQSTQSLHTRIAALVSLYASIIVEIILAFIALQKI
jgi:hypothetical protein